MTIKYLVECSCGQKVPVTTSQADQTVRCPCGQELQVPTLLKLRQLESIEYEPSRADRPNNWGVAQKLITIGVLMIVLATGWLTYVVIFTRPPTPKEVFSEERFEKFEKMVSDMSLLDTFKLWNALRYDIRIKWQDERKLDAMTKTYRTRVSIALVLVGLAVVSTIMTWTITRRVTSRSHPINQSP